MSRRSWACASSRYRRRSSRAIATRRFSRRWRSSAAAIERLATEVRHRNARRFWRRRKYFERPRPEGLLGDGRTSAIGVDGKSVRAGAACAFGRYGPVCARKRGAMARAATSRIPASSAGIGPDATIHWISRCKRMADVMETADRLSGNDGAPIWRCSAACTIRSACPRLDASGRQPRGRLSAGARPTPWLWWRSAPPAPADLSARPPQADPGDHRQARRHGARRLLRRRHTIRHSIRSSTGVRRLRRRET